MSEHQNDSAVPDSEIHRTYKIVGGPGIYTAYQTAAKCNCSVSDLTIFANIKVLKPLGWPLPKNAARTYAKIEVDRFLNSVADMTKARKALLTFHVKKNNSRKQKVKNPKNGE